ncbi:MAG: hypothetical protein ACJ72L_15980 [Marmoricola sp.]
MVRRLALLVPVLVVSVLVPPPARATTRTVVVDNDAFTSSSVTVVLGDTVKWSFKETHSTTSDQGFWDSGHKSSGATYSRVFADAGTYAYHCTIHPMMHGKVLAPVRSSGSASAGYTVRWSTRTGTNSVRYDVQYKIVGTSTWTHWRTGTASRSAGFNPAGAHSYYVHSRTRSGGHTSSWSPSITLKVT